LGIEWYCFGEVFGFVFGGAFYREMRGSVSRKKEVENFLRVRDRKEEIGEISL